MKKIAINNQQLGTRNQEPGTRNQEPDSGFTLLEVMAAVSIIAIVLVSVYRLHAQTLSMNYSARFYVMAPMLAQTKMAEFEAKDEVEMEDDSGDFGDEFPGYRWKAEIEDVESKDLGNVADDLKAINVLVSLNNDEFIYTLKTYRFLQD
jgi:general secretion pathway protein I